MTDPRKAPPGSYWTSGRGAEAGDESRVAANSGRASVRPNRPGAAGPAGWFPPPAGEAAPPVRLREPVRSDGASPYDVETRPTAMYRVPWQSARADRTRRAVRRPQPPAARPHRTAPDDDSASPGTPPDFRAGTPDMRWPSLTRRGPLHVPVAGPTEALRGRAGGPRVEVPPGTVAGLLDRERQSGWQLAQRVWRESGVDWEEPAPAQPDYQAPGPGVPEAAGPPEEDDDYPDDDPLSPGPPVLGRPPVAGRYLTDPHPTSSRPARPARPRCPRTPGSEWDRGRSSRPPSRRAPRPAPARSAAFAPPSPFAPSPAFASPHPFGASPAPGSAPRVPATPPLSAPVASAAPPLGESDELFRAWQGSVREAAHAAVRPGLPAARLPAAGPAGRSPRSACPPRSLSPSGPAR